MKKEKLPPRVEMTMKEYVEGKKAKLNQHDKAIEALLEIIKQLS